MSTLSAATWPGFGLRLPRWLQPWQELRVDVDLQADALEQELETLYARLHAPGDPMHGALRVPTNWPHLVLRCREADGEFYVYVEDTARRRLAGFTVFNRLIEVSRRADRVLRAPHSKYAMPYRRQGIATVVYGWALQAGWCLITGARQSAGAHALWHALAGHWPLIFVDLRNKALRRLDARTGRERLEDFHTRMILLGRDWLPDGLAAACDMVQPDGTPIVRATASACPAMVRKSPPGCRTS